MALTFWRIVVLVAIAAILLAFLWTWIGVNHPSDPIGPTVPTQSG